MVQSRQIQQQKFLSKIKAQFNPLRILQLDRKSVLAGEEQKSGKKEFDTIGVCVSIVSDIFVSLDKHKLEFYTGSLFYIT